MTADVTRWPVSLSHFAFFCALGLAGASVATRGVGPALAESPLTCSISGPNQVAVDVAQVIYSTGPAEPGATYQWHVSGAALIIGRSDLPDIVVAPRFIGSFGIDVTITRDGFPLQCGRTIPVIPPAAGTNPNAKILIHLVPAGRPNACGQGLSNCAAISTSGRMLPQAYFAFLVVADTDGLYGLSGLQCGIDYDPAPNLGVDIYDWVLCASLQFRSAGVNGPWPAAGSGNQITWDPNNGCQLLATGAGVAAGYFYCGAYTPDVLRVTPRPVDGQAKVADCSFVESLIGGTGYPTTVPSHLGSAAFSADGGVPGYNPCGLVTPVRATSWSAIKGMFH